MASIRFLGMVWGMVWGVGLLSGASASWAQATAAFPGAESGPPPKRAEPPDDDYALPAPPPPRPQAAPEPPRPLPPPPAASDGEDGLLMPPPPPPVPQAAQPAAQLGAGEAFRPARLPYVSGDAVPAGYEVDYQPATGAIASGALILGAGYLSAVLAGGDEPGAAYRFLPVFGPFGMLSSRDLRCSQITDPYLAVEQTNACVAKVADEARVIGWLLADGLVQITGASVLLYGLLTGERQLVRSDPQVAAQVGPNSWRLSVSGVF